MIGRGGLESGLRAVRLGQKTFDAFARETRDRWTLIAGTLRCRWDLPTWFSEDDIRQELLTNAWYYLWYYDSRRSRTKSVEHYVVLNAIEATRKRATKARIGRRPHRGGGGRSCYELPASSLTEGADKDFDITEVLSCPATQEEDIDRRRLSEFLLSASKRLLPAAVPLRRKVGPRDKVISEASRGLYDDEDLWWILRLSCEADAQILVEAAVKEFASARREGT
jgi:hypothetical protein